MQEETALHAEQQPHRNDDNRKSNDDNLTAVPTLTDSKELEGSSTNTNSAVDIAAVPSEPGLVSTSAPTSSEPLDIAISASLSKLDISPSSPKSPTNPKESRSQTLP